MPLFSQDKSKSQSEFEIEDFEELPDKSEKQRLPPGQYLAKRWPVLSAERTPTFDGKNWDITVEGLVENPITWTWEEFKKLPKVEQVSDIHCVTTWSLFDQKFGGVAFQTIVDLVKPFPEAKYVTFIADSGYDTALPLGEDYLGGSNVMLAYEHDGEPLQPDHGGPVRSLVPSFFLWKSVKWCKKIVFTDKWERGFWETRGYHLRGSYDLEERYSSQEKPIRRDHKIE
ncbi:MAG: Sulfoxide reductase catalytic subunit YedY [Candidatus Heimdallarchaeota archaeon LC_2]|nr:MAG: Sulfoxide reductase catalytic subunit YedY [Candidatus Heimdallarchaeota archaeon LC_2]